MGCKYRKKNARLQILLQKSVENGLFFTILGKNAANIEKNELFNLQITSYLTCCSLQQANTLVVIKYK